MNDECVIKPYRGSGIQSGPAVMVSAQPALSLRLVSLRAQSSPGRRVVLPVPPASAHVSKVAARLRVFLGRCHDPAVQRGVNVVLEVQPAAVAIDACTCQDDVPVSGPGMKEAGATPTCLFCFSVVPKKDPLARYTTQNPAGRRSRLRMG